MKKQAKFLTKEMVDKLDYFNSAGKRPRAAIRDLVYTVRVLRKEVKP